MKKYFLDTNILLDFLGNRQPFGKYALQILNKGRLKEWELWTSDNSITTSYYIIEREIGEKDARLKIGKLLNYIEIQPVGKPALQTALVSKFKDFEDGVQHFCALSIENIEGFVTRNHKDYKHSQIKVYSPEELFEA
jgi:predicted nucleic acid-binding protein